ncbi:MAG: Clp protease N-terminal domain-containing protein, partial [Omnitrophica WOR_2 bacterium]
MDLNRYTQNAQEAILGAQRIAEEYNQQAIEPSHLLLALLNQEDSIVPAIVTRLAGSVEAL